jgi:hypothetical protein
MLWPRTDMYSTTPSPYFSNLSPKLSCPTILGLGFGFIGNFTICFPFISVCIAFSLYRFISC